MSEIRCLITRVELNENLYPLSLLNIYGSNKFCRKILRKNIQLISHSMLAFSIETSFYDGNTTWRVVKSAIILSTDKSQTNKSPIFSPTLLLFIDRLFLFHKAKMSCLHNVTLLAKMSCWHNVKLLMFYNSNRKNLDSAVCLEDFSLKDNVTGGVFRRLSFE